GIGVAAGKLRPLLRLGFLHIGEQVFRVQCPRAVVGGGSANEPAGAGEFADDVLLELGFPAVGQCNSPYSISYAYSCYLSPVSAMLQEDASPCSADNVLELSVRLCSINARRLNQNIIAPNGRLTESINGEYC